MELVMQEKEEVLDLLEMFNLEGKHLHRGLWVQKAVFIEERSTFTRMDRASFAEALPMLRKKVCSYPIMLSADTLRDGLALDIKISKMREEYVVEFEPAPAKPIKEFLIKDYERQLEKFVKGLREIKQGKNLKRRISTRKREDIVRIEEEKEVVQFKIDRQAKYMKDRAGKAGAQGLRGVGAKKRKIATKKKPVQKKHAVKKIEKKKIAAPKKKVAAPVVQEREVSVPEKKEGKLKSFLKRII